MFSIGSFVLFHLSVVVVLITFQKLENVRPFFGFLWILLVLRLFGKKWLFFLLWWLHFLFLPSLSSIAFIRFAFHVLRSQTRFRLLFSNKCFSSSSINLKFKNCGLRLFVIILMRHVYAHQRFNFIYSHLYWYHRWYLTSNKFLLILSTFFFSAPRSPTIRLSRGIRIFPFVLFPCFSASTADFAEFHINQKVYLTK